MLFWIIVLAVGGYFGYKYYLKKKSSDGQSDSGPMEYPKDINRKASAAENRNKVAQLLRNGFPGIDDNFDNHLIVGLVAHAAKENGDKKYTINKKSYDCYKNVVVRLESLGIMSLRDAWILVFAFTDNYTSGELFAAAQRFLQDDLRNDESIEREEENLNSSSSFSDSWAGSRRG